MYSQANHVRERSRIVFRIASLCAALATALLIAAVAGAQDPQAREGAESQDKATDSGKTMSEQIVFTSTRAKYPDNPTGAALPPSAADLGAALEIYRMNSDGTDPVRL